eukprot:15202495-Heterocapsa_arctica.AAC.1
MADPIARPPSGLHPDAVQEGFNLLSERISATSKVRQREAWFKTAAAVKKQRTEYPKTVILDKKFMTQQGRDTSLDNVAWS